MRKNVASAVLVALMLAGGPAGTGPAAPSSPILSRPVPGSGGSLALRPVATVDLAHPRPAALPSPAASPVRRGAAWHAVPLGRPPFTRRPGKAAPVSPPQ